MPDRRVSAEDERLARLLAGLDADTAAAAEAALAWVLPERAGLGELSQELVQRFLWYELPRKWLTDDAEHHEVAWAFGDLLAAAELTRYADLCRDPATHRVIDAWHRGEAEGLAAFRAAVEASGIDPPETPLLRWGAFMGLDEAAVRYAAALALERAVVDGHLVPGGRGWRQQAARLVDAYLATPQVAFGGARPLDVVRRDRAGRWAQGPPPARQELLAPVLPLLEPDDGVPPEPDEAAAALEPLRWLLERVGDGVTLTQAGYLPKALVVEANDRYGWFDLPGFSVRTENDVHQLADLHELARRTRLLTKRGRRLSVSATGRRAVADPLVLLRVVAEDAVAGADRDLRGEATALAAAVLLTADGPVGEGALVQAVADAVQGRWRTSDGGPVEPRAVRWALRHYLVVGPLLGWLTQSGDWRAREVAMTPLGRAAAVMGLQAQAWWPRQR